ncbi:MAG: aspartate aminotransferase family protein [Candidatus Aminicenantes bacterium]|nr:aspartate aminotransferase family protein [Candidatus Aminicenantes bacterium]
MSRKKPPSVAKSLAIDYFTDHVSSGKASFFKKFGMDFVMGRREGPYLYDIDGEKRLLNLHCNGGVFNLGHRNGELIAILKEALDDLDIGNHHLMSAERAGLAAMLSSLLPGDLDNVVFGTGGGEAVDLAFKVARAYTGRAKIISALGGYHGHTGLALAAGDAKYRDPFGPQLPDFVQVPFGDIDALREATDASTAAVILETVPATLGMVIPSKEYIQAVRDICTRSKALLIMDEVQTGLGRTGRLWGFEHFDIMPDMVVLGKGLSGGLYPISATVLRRPLEEVFHDDPFIHISTFGGAEPGCRVAKRVLEISSSTEFLEHVNHLARLFADGVASLQNKHGRFLKGLRQMGLMMGLELKDPLCGPLLTKTAYDHDLLLIYANNDPSVCQFLPPLVIADEEVGQVLEQLDGALSSAHRLKPLLNLKTIFESGRKKNQPSKR